MILADTSVWIAHFRHGDPLLAERLLKGAVSMHPWISGELACGNLKDRQRVLSDLNSLPSAAIASDAEALELLGHYRLWGRGLGWVDVHLLASALLSNCSFWTLDKQLAAAASSVGLSR